MSERHSIRSEDEPAWNPKDVEESLLHEEINGPERGAKNFHHSYLEYNAAYLIISFFLGALFTFIILSLALSRKRFDSKSDDIQWSIPIYLYFSLIFLLWYTKKKARLVQNTKLKDLVSAPKSNLRFDGTFDRSSPYKGPPSPEVDALWDEIKMYHCADVLRQKLMCDADTDIVTYNWLKGKVNPNPNFNVQHQCRNFDAILDYARDNQVDKDDTDRIDVDLLKPENGNIMEFEGEPPFDSDAVPSMRQE
ncbi:hypothetical protein BcDW1_8042 [Botrytis cinerea BcDW1]|uniref:Uncharacterized protein n=1 Tax=Botryotinia fuckeliana (strain BcDW1) TaxID=1290391 RepID=M7UIH3_BOTF1|nr:hypothetical protein BcDW1_8042 [Botrytis cinerea BcDW1]